jgi:cytochrome b pre-mRNA-processing protein 3
MLFRWIKHKALRRKNAKELYQAALTQSRQAGFYANMGVADTMDGRFDMLCVHIILIVERLNGLGRDGAKLGQAVFDAMFKRMDLDLREMGIGDLGVPKHMKKMMKAFNGRRQAYYEAMEKQDIIALENAVAKNIFRLPEGDAPPQAKAMAGYILHARNGLMAATLQDFEAARIRFPELSKTQHKAA